MYVPSHCVSVVCEEMGCFGILHMKASNEKVTWLCGIVKFLERAEIVVPLHRDCLKCQFKHTTSEAIL